MQDNTVWSSSLIGTIVGLCVRWAALIPVVPPWLAQIAATAAAAAVGTLASLLMKKVWRRFFPSDRRLPGDTDE